MESGVSYTSLDPAGADRFQRLRQEEAYLVLEGTLTLLVEDEPRDLRRGDLARVAPDLRRQLVNRTRDPLFVLAIGGANEHEGRDGRAYESWDDSGEGRPRRRSRSPRTCPYDRDE
jgi:uncharacterized cupin superfamily protein